MAANAVYLLADAIGRAASRERDAVQAAMLSSAFSDHGMPYGPTRFVNGQNIGAAAALTQVQEGEIRLIGPAGFADAELRVGPPPPPLEADAGTGPEAGTLEDDVAVPDFSTLQETPLDEPSAPAASESPPAVEAPSPNG